MLSKPHGNILQIKHGHPRDQFIKFYNKGHKYEILTDTNSKYLSVTTWNHKHFPKFDPDVAVQNIFKSKQWGPTNKYWGMTAEQIKNSWKSNGNAVANAGTNLHERIECFMNGDISDLDINHDKLYEDYEHSETFGQDDCVEWNYFIQFVKDHPTLKPYRTEWMIFDEDLKLAGSIDMVYENPDGTLEIYDWKRCKEIVKTTTWNKFAINPLICHMPDTNFWHYTLQLNTYKTILERKYGKIVSKLCLVQLHPDNQNNCYELHEVPMITREIQDLFEERYKEVC